MRDDPTLDHYLSVRPTDEETAQNAVRPYRAMDAAARLDSLAVLLRGMDLLLAGRRPVTSPDDAAFWRHWSDPSLGCPR